MISLEEKLVHAITQWDRKQRNPHAGAIALRRLDSQQRARRYRERAEELRTLAYAFSHRSASAALEHMADSYERMALQHDLADKEPTP